MDKEAQQDYKHMDGEPSYQGSSNWLFTNISPLIDKINKMTKKLENIDLEPFL
jgi:hypothetical protein